MEVAKDAADAQAAATTRSLSGLRPVNGTLESFSDENVVGHFDCDAKFSAADKMTWTPILQSHVFYLSRWVQVQDGVWRSEQEPFVVGVAALMAFTPQPHQDGARFRLVLRDVRTEAGKTGSPKQWPVIPLHDGWTEPASNVLDFTGRLMPAPKINAEWSCAALFEQRKWAWLQKLAAEDRAADKDFSYDPSHKYDGMVSPVEMTHTLDFSRMNGVYVECTCDPGEVALTLLPWNLLMTLGSLRAPKFIL